MVRRWIETSAWHMGLLLVLWRGRLRTTIVNMWGIVTHWHVAGLKPHPPSGQAERCLRRAAL